ncbi:YihY/virulence factor BrkB family protein [Phenylobacterium sp.]|nr:YihY/virulence factor BrkB family protein [Phenylobacterium sp.]MDP1617022.1 YihY/virulence factor BrkB family protein [Phenylobacterium sp.]
MPAPRSTSPRRRIAVDLARKGLVAAPWVALAALAFWKRRLIEPPPGMSRAGAADPQQIETEEPGRGRLAGHPRDIPPHGWKDVIWRTLAEINRDQLPRVAAGVTFYTLLAIVPALAVFVSLYGLFADIGQVQSQLAQMSQVIPGDVVDIVGEQMKRLAVERKANLSLAFAFSLLLSVWTASNAVRALVEGVNIAYDENEKRNIVQLMALTYAATFATLAFLILVTGLLVAAPIALKLLGLGSLEVFWGPLRWMILLAIGAMAFTILYRYGPCRALARWRWVAPGGIFASVVWMGGSLGFSWYINNIARYDATYGSLGAIIGFMMWIWFSVMVVLLGAELNAEIEHQTALDSTTGPEQPLGQRGATMADTVGLALTTTLADAVGAVRSRGANLAARLRRAKPSEPEG